jgi:hypothetical protein
MHIVPRNGLYESHHRSAWNSYRLSLHASAQFNRFMTNGNRSPIDDGDDVHKQGAWPEVDAADTVKD